MVRIGFDSEKHVVDNKAKIADHSLEIIKKERYSASQNQRDDNFKVGAFGFYQHVNQNWRHNENCKKRGKLMR